MKKVNLYFPLHGMDGAEIKFERGQVHGVDESSHFFWLKNGAVSEEEYNDNKEEFETALDALIESEEDGRYAESPEDEESEESEDEESEDKPKSKKIKRFKAKKKN